MGGFRLWAYGESEPPGHVEPEPLGYEVPTVEEMCQGYPRLWATVRRDFPDLGTASQLQIAGLALGRGICSACHDAEAGCQCWNDE